MQLAEAEFRTDQIGLWLAELELGLEFAEVVQAHAAFYQALKRKEALKGILTPDDTAGLIRLKMLAICAGCKADPRLDAVLENLLQELANGRDSKIKLICRCGLETFLWEQMQRCYGYKSEEPGVHDFTVELFKSCYAMGTDGQVELTGDALVFLKRWKDSRQFEDGFEILSSECAGVLGVEADLTKRDYSNLLELDYFRLIDQKIISDLVHEVSARTVSSPDVSLWIRQRRQSHWYHEFRHLYEAIDFAARFIHGLDEVQLTMDSLADGVQRYSRSWYQLDQLYRKFIYHMRMSAQASLLGDLTEQIENLYTNNYLLKLGNLFQEYVEATDQWDAPPVPLQRNFFERWVRPFVKKEKKVCVIISDAMRYEIGEELLRRIRQEDRYHAKLSPALAMLPSYTQLGMAALLPGKELVIVDNKTATVQVDGISSQGTANRIKILRQEQSFRATALKADEVMAKNGDDCRTLFRDHDVVYIYHNRIDATGDKRDSEEEVFEAVEDTLQKLILLLKKLTGANATNLLITADHGFIYQNRVIEESDFSDSDIEGDQILYRDRRFILGKGLKETQSLHQFHPAQLGLGDDVEVQIPKSINRLRLQGSGSRFVHGGASLQEVVVPVLEINKKRTSDVSATHVDILRGASSVITAGQLSVTLYQNEAVTEKVQARILTAGIFTEEDELISDQHDLTFDLTSDNPRDRELQVRFLLTRKADEVNGQEVILKLLEKHARTSHYKVYKSLRYFMRRSFTTDFDF